MRTSKENMFNFYDDDDEKCFWLVNFQCILCSYHTQHIHSLLVHNLLTEYLLVPCLFFYYYISLSVIFVLLELA